MTDHEHDEHCVCGARKSPQKGGGGPTGTTAVLSDRSTGIEPVHSARYERKLVVDPQRPIRTEMASKPIDWMEKLSQLKLEPAPELPDFSKLRPSTVTIDDVLVGMSSKGFEAGKLPQLMFWGGPYYGSKVDMRALMLSCMSPQEREDIKKATSISPDRVITKAQGMSALEAIAKSLQDEPGETLIIIDSITGKK